MAHGLEKAGIHAETSLKILWEVVAGIALCPFGPHIASRNANANCKTIYAEGDQKIAAVDAKYADNTPPASEPANT